MKRLDLPDDHINEAAAYCESIEKSALTPPPWKWNFDFNHVPTLTEDHVRNFDFRIATCSSAADAAHIVKCVNLHDELFEIAQWTYDNVVMHYDKIGKLNTLLKRAKGE